jgi:NAD(P)-dependent dehydrogenase (short-subunit alcohol dehydrogenase family)
MRELPTARFFGIEFSDLADARRAASHLTTEDPIDVLVNNVAPDIKTPFRQLSTADFELQLQAGCMTAFVMTRAIGEAMKVRRRGSIVNLCAASHNGEWDGYVSYAASNGAIIGLTRSMARELGAYEVRVNAISIGAVSSLGEARIFGDRLAEYDEWVIRNQCIKRRILPEDVAELVLFLASERSSMITGQNIVIDGGW